MHAIKLDRLLFLFLLPWLVSINNLTAEDEAREAQDYLGEAERRFPLLELSYLAFEEHYIRHKIKERSSDEKPEADSFVGKNGKVADGSLAKSQAFAEVEDLLLRAIQATPNNAQAKFRLAFLTSFKVNAPDSSQESDRYMSEVAFSNANETPQAHAWLAASLMGRSESLQPLSPMELTQLESHLESAVQWLGIDPALVNTYVTLCLQSGKLEKALSVAKQTSDLNPAFSLSYAKLCKKFRSSNEKEIIEVSKTAERFYREKLGTLRESESDRVGLAESLDFQGRRELAMEILEDGLANRFGGNKMIQKTLVDLHIDEFRRVIESSMKHNKHSASDANGAASENADPLRTEKKHDPADIDWKELRKAAEVDRMNPAIGQAVAFRWRRQAKPPEDLLEVVYEQLDANIASIATQLMVAEIYLTDGSIGKAKKRWEAILARDGDVIPALNNLSLVISRETPPQSKRAVELIDRAYRLHPKNAEICDSYGEILMNVGRIEDAIAKFEESLQMDSIRVATRRRLVKCYREVGMEERAVEQEFHIEPNLKTKK